MITRFLRAKFSTSALKTIKDVYPIVDISMLNTGPTLMTEKSSFPTYSDIGLCFKTGHRDEKELERGALIALKQRLYHTNQDDFLSNFESTLRSGCLLELNQDQELTYYKCSFLQDDLEYTLDILLKLALSIKQIHTSEDSEVVDQSTLIPFDELIIKAAFSNQQMGNLPSYKRSDHLDQSSFQKFQKELFTPQNLTIGYAGVLDHNQFKEMLESRLKNFPEFLSRKVRASERAHFTPGSVHQELESSEDINIAIIYEGYSWRHPDMAIFQVLEKILGNSSSWSTGGPGKGMRARTTINSKFHRYKVMNQIQSIESAGAINNHFIETGLFGIKVSGWFQSKDELLDCVVKEFKRILDPMTDEEFKRGQNILNSLIQLNLERQADRLEEQVKNLFTFGRLTVPEYMDKIKSVTKQQVQEKVRQLIYECQPVVVYQGKGASQLPKMEKVVQMLRR